MNGQKNTWWLMVLVLLTASLVLAGWVSSHGKGGIASVGITEYRIDLGEDFAYKVSIYNPYTNDIVYAQVNVSSAEFAVNVTNVMSCVVIAPETVFTFENQHDRSWHIKTISMQRLSTTNDVYVGIH